MDTLKKLAEKLNTGEITSSALVEQAIERIDDPAGEGARIFLSVNRDKARKQAQVVDNERKNANPLPPLCGIPFSAKDLCDIEGQVTTAGSKVLQNAPAARRTAEVVKRLEAAGMINIGRTNMSEFAYSGLGLNPHYGTPKSTWDRSTGRAPGGSSSGSAVSVCDNIVPATIGTDTGGSCRIPAAFNGITGYKPSFGRIPDDGVYPLSVSLDTPGPLAHSVSCCFSLDQIMAGENQPGLLATLSPAAISEIKLTVPQSLMLEDLDQEVAAAFSNSLSALSRAGFEIIERPVPLFHEIAKIGAVAGIAQREAYQLHKERLESHGEEYDPFVRWRILAAANITEAMFEETLRRRCELIAEAAKIIDTPFHAFAFPTAPILPPKLSDVAELEAFKKVNFRALRNTSSFNFLNGCSISLPATTKGEAPVGFMLSMMHNCDHNLFKISAAVETVLQAQMK